MRISRARYAALFGPTTGDQVRLGGTDLWIEVEESRRLCDDPAKRTEVADELADVLIYALRFADVAGLDATEAILEKMARNEERYPVEKAKGSSAKYDEL